MKWITPKKSVVILGTLIFLSFLLRIFTSISDVVHPDSCLYLSFAKSILNGKFYFNFQGGVEKILPPLYPISNAVVTFFMGDIELSAILVSVIAGALLIIPVFYLTKAIYNEKAAWISSVLVFLSPVLLYRSGMIQTESLFITLFISGSTIGWYAIERRRRIFFFLSGALVGLSYLTRIIGLVAIPVLGVWMIFYFIRPDKSGNSIWGKPADSGHYNLGKICKDMIIFWVIFSLGFFLVTGLYLIHLRSVFGQWTLSASYGSIKGMVESEGAATSAGWEKLTSRGDKENLTITLLKKVILNAQNYSTSLLSILYFTIIFIIAGLFYKWKILYVVLVIATYLAALLVQPLSPFWDDRVRYLSPILPLLLVMASGGIICIQEWMKWVRVKQIVIPVAVGIILVSSIPQLKMFPIHFNKPWNRNDHINFKKMAGLWMKKNLPQPIKAMSRKPFIPYYADAIWFGTPTTYKEVVEQANNDAIDYIVIDRSIDYYLRPELRFLFDPKQAPNELEFIGGIRYLKTGELYIVVYKIKRNK